MKNSKFLRSGVALRSLAMLGAGIPASMMLAAPAAAQDFTNVTASGRVRTTANEPVVGATVTVTSDAQGFTRTGTTDGSGGFLISQLPPGNYTFSISGEGFETLTEAGVRIDQENAANEFTVAAAGGAAAAADGEGAEIVVTGRRQIVDFTANTTGAVINVGNWQRAFRSLATSHRSFCCRRVRRRATPRSATFRRSTVPRCPRTSIT